MKMCTYYQVHNLLVEIPNECDVSTVLVDIVNVEQLEQTGSKLALNWFKTGSKLVLNWF